MTGFDQCAQRQTAAYKCRFVVSFLELAENKRCLAFLPSRHFVEGFMKSAKIFFTHFQ
jgi:hypothetical protein